MKNFLNKFEIFQNKVGRPSNEVLRKRKIFYSLAIGLCVLLVGGMVLFLSHHNSNKLSGGLFSFGSKRFVIKYDKENALSIGKLIDSCTTKTKYCDVTLPSITPKKGYEVVGWEADIAGKHYSFKPGIKLGINQNVTLHAITKKIGSSSGRSRFLISDLGNHCYKVTPPSDISSYKLQIRHKKYWFSLYNKKKIYDKTFSGVSDKICLQKKEYDPEYQAIYLKANAGKAKDWKPDGAKTNLSGWAYSEYRIDWPSDNTNGKNTFTIKFEKGNAVSIGDYSRSCSTDGNNCNITLPSINVPSGYDGVWEVKNEGERYNPGTSLNVNRNLTMVAVAKKKRVTQGKFTVTEAGCGPNLNPKTTACYDVFPPKGTNNYRVIYYIKKDGKLIQVDKKDMFNRTDGAWYPLTKKYTDKETLVIAVKATTGSNDTVLDEPRDWMPEGGYTKNDGWAYKEFTVDWKAKNPVTTHQTPSGGYTRPTGNNDRFTSEAVYTERGKINIFVEKGCNSKYKKNVDRVRNDLKSLPDKILPTIRSVYLETSSTFHRMNPSFESKVLGLTWSTTGRMSSDIEMKCDSNYEEILTQEMGHAFDHAARYKYGQAYSAKQEFINLYNRDKNKSTTRGWAKASSSEFFADVYAYYFLKKMAPASRWNASGFKRQGASYDLNLMTKYVNEWK